MDEKLSTPKEYGKRLRARCLEGGGDFSGREVLELLLTFAARNADARVAAEALLKRFGGLRGVLDAPLEDLSEACGTQSAAIFLKLVKDVSGACLKESVMGSDVLSDPKGLIDYLTLALSGERVEKFLAVYMNSRNEAVAIETLHEGTINQTAVYPRKAIELAFRHKASSVIFVHNHPSGDPTPSSADRELTRTLDNAALAVGLMVQDHIIVGRDNVFRAREHGWIIGVPKRS